MNIEKKSEKKLSTDQNKAISSGIETIYISGVLFDKRIKAHSNRLKFDLKKIQKLKKPEWYLHKKSYIQQEWSQIISYVVQAKCQMLYLNSNQLPTIITTIQLSQWAKLWYLTLSNNKITNVEALVFLNMPQVQEINLRDNYIMNVKALDKLNAPKLVAIYIEDNKIQSIKLGRILFQKKKQINLKINKNVRSFYENLYLYAKLKATKSIELFKNDFPVNEENALVKCLRKKYNSKKRF